MKLSPEAKDALLAAQHAVSKAVDDAGPLMAAPYYDELVRAHIIITGLIALAMAKAD